MEKIKIYNEDVLVGLSKIETNTVDLVISDPPYNISKDFGECKDNLSLKDYLNWSKLWIIECLRILKPTGSMFIYGFPEYASFLHTHILYDLDVNTRWLVWHYENRTVPSSKDWQRSHESILHVRRDSSTFNLDAIREPYSDTFLKNSVGKVRRATKGRFSNGTKETTYTAHEGGALPRDVIKIPVLAGGAGAVERICYCHTCEDSFFSYDNKLHEGHNVEKHPTQKPFSLTKKLIDSSILPEQDSLIVIPFCGSGSECFVVKEYNQQAISFDLNLTYVTMARKILEKKFLTK